jgi:hypothetical protein
MTHAYCELSWDNLWEACDYFISEDGPRCAYRINGYGLAVFSSCRHSLVTWVGRMSAAIWMWNVKQMELHSVIVHKQPVTVIYWFCNKMYAGGTQSLTQTVTMKTDCNRTRLEIK